MIYLGCFFLWGNIATYVLSYFWYIDDDLSYDFIFLVDTFLIISNWIGYQVGVYLFMTLGINQRIVIGLGGFISLAGVFFSSFTRTLFAYLSFYCVFNGIGCGMCYFVALICAWEWFPTKKGLVTGVTLGGYGFGSFIFAQISTKLVNPTGENPEPLDPDNPDVNYFTRDVADRVPFMIRTLVYIWAVLVTIAVILINRRPKDF